MNSIWALLLGPLPSSRKASICFTSSSNSCNLNVPKITNKVFDLVKYLDFEVLGVITIDNVVELDGSVPYGCTLPSQAPKEAAAKVD